MQRLLITLAAALCTLVNTAPAQQKLTFDVASVHENKSGGPQTTNLFLGPGAVYNSANGIVVIRNYPLLSFFIFSYKLSNSQAVELYSNLPDWAKQTRYDIQARTENTAVTKDELRLMMQALLADRFGAAAHFSTKNQAVLAMHLVKPGTLGPRLIPRTQPCDRLAPDQAKGANSPTAILEGGFPVACGGNIILPGSSAKQINAGGRDVTLAEMAGDFATWGNLPKPVIDATGLTDRFDFALSYVPDFSDPLAAPAPTADQAPNFVESLRKQLGLKLENERADIPVLIVDTIHPLTGN